MYLRIKKEIFKNENLNLEIESINYYNYNKFKDSFKNDKLFYNFNENELYFNDYELKIRIYLYNIIKNYNYKYIEITFIYQLDYLKFKNEILNKSNDYKKYNIIKIF